MLKEGMRNLHVPLAEALYRRLREEAERSRRPATDLAREAIAAWLAEQERLLTHQSIAAYAQETAGSADDLDTELEAAGVEHLLDIEEESRKDGTK
jgi:predicted transcriptional regulator